MGAYLGELLVRHDGGRWQHWEGEKKPTVAIVFDRQDFAAFPLDKATKRVWKPREHDLAAFVETVRRELAERQPA